MLLRPVILIHDLGGSPQDWSRWGLISYLVNVGGLDPRLIRRFDYGYVRHGTVPQYNAQGDLIQVAHRLSDDPAIPGGEVFQVDALAAESQAMGGPDKVSIVAVGAGGIIARYYLSRSTPDKWGTRYNGRVDKVILVGVPNRGITSDTTLADLQQTWWARLLLARETKAAMKSVMEGFTALREQVLGEMPGEDCPAISPKALGLLQITRESFLLRWLNRPECTPRHVRFYCLLGQIDMCFLVPTRRYYVPVNVTFGDLLTKADSAMSIPGARPQLFVFNRAYGVDIARRAPPHPLDWFGGDLPPVAHTRLMGQREVHETILRILAQD